MLVSFSRALSFAGILALASAGNTAYGQFWFNDCCCCCPPPPVRVQPMYQTVPVTEYREVRQVVQKPVVETKYVEQPVTEYRQVVENKTAEIPTVSYQPVTEYQTVQRDCGRWQTNYHYRPKMAPCQYDGRPDLFGFLNRTQYSMRMAFTPDYYAERTYVPNVVAHQIPVTRQVAVRGTQTVNYQVSRTVPVTTTRKVAVNSVRMVAQEVVTQQPVTVYRTVPFGSTYAFGTPAGSPSTTTALQPTPDPVSTAIRPKDATKTTPSEDRSANRPNPLDDKADDFDNREGRNDGINRSRTSLKIPAEVNIEETASIEKSSGWRVTKKADKQPAGRWVARKKPQPVEGPAFPEMIVAQNSAPRK